MLACACFIFAIDACRNTWARDGGGGGVEAGRRAERGRTGFLQQGHEEDRRAPICSSLTQFVFSCISDTIVALRKRLLLAVHILMLFPSGPLHGLLISSAESVVRLKSASSSFRFFG